MQPLIGPAGFGRPATPAEASAFHAELPWVRAARLAAYRRRALGSRRRERERLRREARQNA